MIYPYLLTAVIGLFGALLFTFLHFPMAWLLGPLTTVLLFHLNTTLPLKWHKNFRDFGLILAGYSIGQAFTIDSLQDIIAYFPMMLGLNIFYIIIFILLSWVIMKRTRMDQLTVLTSVVPGGMTQIVSYAEEQGSKNITMISFYQVLRVLCILAIVPILLHTTTDTVNSMAITPASYNWLLIFLLFFSIISGKLANSLKIPTGFMLGPIILLIILQLFHLQVPTLPSSALHLAQLVIGIYIGLLLNKENLKLSKRLIFYGFFSSFIYVFSAYLLAKLTALYFPISFPTAFLSIVPGGLDQMSIIAATVQADTPFVTSFQLFRVLIVTLLIIPALKLFISKR